jgi:hypothetical protein
MLLAELRCMALYHRLMAAEVDAVGVALRGGLVDHETAMEWLREMGMTAGLRRLNGSGIDG